LVQAHYDIRTVQELMGHSDVKTTMIYLQISDPGGDLNACQTAFRSAAFQCIKTVGFHLQSFLCRFSNDHHSTFFGAQY
jgi:hypothetical protein